MWYATPKGAPTPFDRRTHAWNERERKKLATALLPVMMRLRYGSVSGPFQAPAPGGVRVVAAGGAAAAAVSASFVGATSCGAPGALALGPPVISIVLSAAAVVMWLGRVPTARRDLAVLLLGSSMALVGLAALQDLLACLLHGAWYAGDVLRGAALVFAVAAVVAEIVRRRRRAAALRAAREQRRRVARELDGPTPARHHATASSAAAR